MMMRWVLLSRRRRVWGADVEVAADAISVAAVAEGVAAGDGDGGAVADGVLVRRYYIRRRCCC